MEVGTRLVYPHQTMHDDIQIDTSSYAMFKVDIMHENFKNLKLQVPSDDMILTLWGAMIIRVQWRRTSIDIHPSAATSASTTASQPNTSLASIFPDTKPY
jgi:hypothetical protein